MFSFTRSYRDGKKDLKKLQNISVHILISCFYHFLKNLGNNCRSRWVRPQCFHIFNSVDSLKGSGRSYINKSIKGFALDSDQSFLITWDGSRNNPLYHLGHSTESMIWLISTKSIMGMLTKVYILAGLVPHERWTDTLKTFYFMYLIVILSLVSNTYIL